MSNLTGAKSDLNRLLIGICLALALLGPLLVPGAGAEDPSEAPTADGHEHGSSDRPGTACPDVRAVGGLGDACRHPNGLWEVFGRDGRSLGMTHGFDPVPVADEPQASAGARAPPCTSDPLTDYHHVFIYAVAHDDTDRYSTVVSDLRQLVHDINGKLYDESATLGSAREYPFHCTSGTVTIAHEVLPTNKASATFSTIVQDLRNVGYDNKRIKYWVWYDDNDACSCGGVGHIYDDDKAGVTNANNGNANSMFGVNFGYLSVRISMHENGHNMGAVQNSSPNSSGGFHCNDGKDIMCYADGGSTSNYDGTVCSKELFDCNHDDYFHVAPPTGSYLDTHWNLGDPTNRFLVVGNAAPTMSSLSCSPSTADTNEAVTCTFQADDDSSGVFYDVDWGDGTSTRVPSSGTVTPGTSQTATHAWTNAGSYSVQATPTDNEDPPLTGAALTTTVDVAVVNGAPTMASLSCAPEPTRTNSDTTCSFHADDDSNGVHYDIDWGDGTSTRVPTSGTVTPGTTQSAVHQWSSLGTYTISVTATDDASQPLTSKARTTSVTVQENTAPAMEAFTCTPSTSEPGEAVSCTLRAGDDSTGVWYSVDWGDGSTQRIPATGTIAPGTNVVVSHTWTDLGTYALSAEATDNEPAPLTSQPMTRNQNVADVNEAPIITLFDCQPNPAIVDAQSTCEISSSDDSNGVWYELTWGDGTRTRLPDSGAVAPGTPVSASHAWSSTGTYTIQVTVHDDGSPSLSASTSQSIQVLPACDFDVTGTLTIGLGGLTEPGLTSNQHEGVQGGCGGRSWQLSSSGSIRDLDVCWYAGSEKLSCTRDGTTGLGGTVPIGADRVEVILVQGLDVNYRLRVL